MKLTDYKGGLIVEVKGKEYGTYKTFALEPKGKGARIVKLLHSAMGGEIKWNFAFIRYARLVDIKLKSEE